MHRSKLSTFVIDCKTEDLDAAAGFWSQALRRGVKAPQAGEERYRDLACGPTEALVMIQKVSHEGRVHLDIESDDIEAEVARLTALGARPVERVRSWVVMEAPTGQRFCVVRPQRPGWEPPFPTATAAHQRLQGLVGHYAGRTRTFLDPDGPPDESSGELHVAAVSGGRWLRLEEQGVVAGQPHAGELLVGFHRDASEYELCWIDSFHTGSAMLWSRGPAREDGIIAATGSYAAGGERWGWRTEIHGGAGPGGPLVLRAVNISPSGEEYPAIESVWERL